MRLAEETMRDNALNKKDEMESPAGDMRDPGATAHSDNYREVLSKVDGDIGTERPGRVGLCMNTTSVGVGMTGALRARVLL